MDCTGTSGDPSRRCSPGTAGTGSGRPPQLFAKTNSTHWTHSDTGRTGTEREREREKPKIRNANLGEKGRGDERAGDGWKSKMICDPARASVDWVGPKNAFCLSASLPFRYNRSKEDPFCQFLMEAENNPLCRKLQLKDMIPVEMQRLVKYPLVSQHWSDPIDHIRRIVAGDSGQVQPGAQRRVAEIVGRGPGGQEHCVGGEQVNEGGHNAREIFDE